MAIYIVKRKDIGTLINAYYFVSEHAKKSGISPDDLVCLELNDKQVKILQWQMGLRQWLVPAALAICAICWIVVDVILVMWVWGKL